MKMHLSNTLPIKTILIVLFLSSANFAQVKTSRFDSLLTAGVHQIYNIKFEAAEFTVNLIKKEFPKHPAGYFFDAMIYWWKIMLDFDNEDYDDTLVDKLEEVIDLCDDILDEDPENVDAVFF